MSFTIPNDADTTIDNQSELDSVDIETFVRGMASEGVIAEIGNEMLIADHETANRLNVGAGAVFTRQSTGSLKRFDFASIVNIDLDAAPTSGGSNNPRFDLVVISQGGTLTKRKGTEAAAPVFPALTTGDILLAAVWRRVDDDQIVAADIVDKRILIAEPFVYNVQHYGAEGTGVVNDYISVQAAIDKCDTDGGGTVYFPAGTYLISTLLAGKPNIHFTGDGYASVIRVNTAAQDAIFFDQDADGWTISNLRFQAGATMTDAAPAGAAIHMRNNRQCQVYNIWIDGVGEGDKWAQGLYVNDVDEQSASRHFNMENFNISHISSIANSAGIRINALWESGGNKHGWGWYFNNGTVQTQTDIAQNDFTAEGRYGCFIESVDGLRMVGVEFIDFQKGLYIDDTNGVGTPVLGVTTTRFENCSFECEGFAAAIGAHISTDGGTMMFTSCIFSGGGGPSDGARSLDIDQNTSGGLSSVSFSTCHFVSPDLDCVRIQNTAGGDIGPFRFVGSIFQGSGGIPDVGLSIGDDVKKVIVTGCDFADLVDGIEVLGTHDAEVLINGCNFHRESFHGDTVTNPFVMTNTRSPHGIVIEGCWPTDINTNRPEKTLQIHDDFFIVQIATDEIGDLGWRWTGPGLISDSDVGAILDHPGYVEIDSGNVDTNDTRLYLPRNETGYFALYGFDSANFYEFVWIATCITTSDVTTRFGIANGSHADPNNTTSGDFVGFDHRDGDSPANWYAVSRTGGVGETRTDTGITFDTSWHRFMVRKTATARLEFWMDDALEATHTGNVPDGTASGPIAHIKTHAALDKTIRIDLFSLRIPFLGR